jgi:hypothetical protein
MIPTATLTTPTRQKKTFHLFGFENEDQSTNIVFKKYSVTLTWFTPEQELVYEDNQKQELMAIPLCIKM